MAGEPVTTEATAVTNMKIEMTLDEIIKLSKKDKPNRKNARGSSNKSRKNLKGSARQSNSTKAWNFLESRSSIRQGVLAKRRTNLQRDQFQVTTEAARKAAAAPLRNWGAGNWNKMREPSFQITAAEGDVGALGKNKPVPQQRQTLDARFAIMAMQRKQTFPPQRLPLQKLPPRGGGSRGRNEKFQQPREGRASGFLVGFAHKSGYFRP